MESGVWRARSRRLHRCGHCGLPRARPGQAGRILRRIRRIGAWPRCKAAAYIVTYGKDAAAAEAEPHAISYADFVGVDGTQLASTWTFWNWSEERGLIGEPNGTGKLTELRFVEPALDAFLRLPDSREDSLPGR